MESLSSYARQFLGQMEKPNVDYKYRCDYLLYSYENGKFVQRMKMDCKEKGNVVGYIRGTYIGDSFYLLYEDGMVQKYSLDHGELAETLE